MSNCSYSTLYKYFDIKSDKIRFFRNVINDGFGLYSIVNWNSAVEYTSDNSNNSDNSYKNIILNKKKKDVKLLDKLDKLEEGNQMIEFGENVDVKSLFPISKYSPPSIFTVIGVYNKLANGIMYKLIILKKKILKEIDTNDYYIFFGYGDVIDLYQDKLNIKKIVRFIYSKLLNAKLLNAALNIDNLVLFGYSMGGNIAQHVAVKLINDKKISASKISLISVSVGNTLSEADLKLLNENLEGKMISMTLISSENITDNNIDSESTLLIDEVFFSNKDESNKDKSNNTLKSILILVNKADFDLEDEFENRIPIKPLNFYNDEIIAQFSLVKSDRELHSFLYIRDIIQNLK